METRMMPEFLMPYGASFGAWLCVGGTYLVQALVAGLAAIRAHHTPGMPVAGGHDNFLFRATRSHANTNESLPAFVGLSLAAMVLTPWAGPLRVAITWDPPLDQWTAGDTELGRLVGHGHGRRRDRTGLRP